MQVFAQGIVDFINECFLWFGVSLQAENAEALAVGMLLFFLVALVLRILVGAVYYSNLSALALFTKPVKKKEEIKKTPSSLINRSVAEYMACGENGAPLSPVELIVQKNIQRASFLGINLKSMEKLAFILELTVMAAAVITAVVYNEIGWILIFGGIYGIYRLILLFFDGEALRSRLFYGLSTYINREIGRFYIGEEPAGMRIFKNEIHSTLMEQASILQNAINNMNSSLTVIVRESYGSLQDFINGDLKKYNDIGDGLKQPVEKLGDMMRRLEETALTLQGSVHRMDQSVSMMDERLAALTQDITKNSEANLKNIENSEIVFKELRDSLKAFNAAYGALEAELAAVKNVQGAMDRSLQGYEDSLQKMVGDLSEAAGNIVEFRGKAATEALNESIIQHIRQFQTDSAAMLEKMSSLFEQSYEQNRSEIKSLLRIEDLLKEN